MREIQLAPSPADFVDGSSDRRSFEMRKLSKVINRLCQSVVSKSSSRRRSASLPKSSFRSVVRFDQMHWKLQQPTSAQRRKINLYGSARYP